MTDTWRQSDEAIRNLIAREIWRYQECEEAYGHFDTVSSDTVGMGALIKQTALDQAELIRAVVVNSPVLRGRLLLSADPWLSIESAPKDGTHILACRIPLGIRVTINTHPPTVVHWFDDPDEPGFYTSVNERAPEHPYNPTHWQPLSLPSPSRQESRT